jgi:cell division protein FtsB
MLGRKRALALAGVAVVALFYWKPLRTYQHTRTVLHRREAEVALLRQQQQQLQHRLATVGTGEQLTREARRLGLVKPGEQLFIVRGIAAWRHKH